MEHKDFRKEIGILMKAKKVNTARLSRLADLNPATVYSFLAGKTAISSLNLAKLFNALYHLTETK